MIVPNIGIQGLSPHPILHPAHSSLLIHHYLFSLQTPNIKIGQLRLKNAKVLIIGAGGLGCPAAAYIAGSGVGTLGLVDGDTVELSNLHRQILHSTARVGMKKVDSAVEFLRSYPLPFYFPISPLHFPLLSNFRKLR